MQNSIDKKFATVAWAGAGLAVFVFAVVALTVFGGTRYWTNGREIKTPTAGAPLRRILWLPAQPVPSVTDADQYEPKVSADGLTMVFVRRRAGSNADLFEARWSPNGWSEATPIEAVNTEKDELGPELSRDGSELYFYSDREGSLGGYDIWVTRLAGGKWGAPANLGASVNSGANEYGPALAADGKTLYFASNRLRAGEPVREADAWPATMREKRSRHDYDLYSAKAGAGDGAQGSWNAALALEGLNTTFDEGAPACSPAGDFLYFASDRPKGLGGFDLYRSRMLEDRIGVPENLGDAVNSAQNDLDAGLSADGFRLYFSSDRGIADAARGGSAGREATSRYSLWSTASREVFVEVESGNQLARLWNLILPLLPWIGAFLLALIPLALLIWMLRNELWRRRLGRLSLLAQCLLISLLIHAAITAGLAVWKVGSGIAEVIKSGGGTRVILASSGGVGDVGGQLGAPATQVSIELPPLAMVGMEKPIEASIAAPMTLELPASRTPVQERMAVQSRASPESQTSEVRVPDAPSATPSIRAATPSAERQMQTREANAEPMRAADVNGAAPVAPVEMSVVRAPVVEMPKSATPASARLDSANSIATEGSRASERDGSEVSPTTVALPASATAADGVVAPLPRAVHRGEGVIEKEATLGGPVAASSASMAAPAPSFAAGPLNTSVPLPAMASGGVAPSRISGAAIGMESAATADEAGIPMKTSAPVGAQSQSVSAQLPTTGARNVSKEAGVGESAATKLRGAAMQAPAPVGISGPKSAEVGTIGLPSGSAGVRAERLATSGFGSAAEPAASLGGVTFDAGLLGTSPGGLGALRLPADIAEPVKPIDTQEQRAPESRGEMLARMGGSAETEKAVGLALEWFTKHQESDGRWSGKNFDAHCGKCEGAAEIDADAAMTGIVLLCYLGAGHTHLAEGPYREPVAKALKWLVDRQASSGDLRRGETMYGQTLSTVALCEALAMTKDQRLTAPTRRAVNFVLQTSARQSSGQTREEDTSVLGWLVMTVESARRAGIAVPRDVFEGAGKWLDQASSSGAPGKYSYVRGGPASAAMTAEAMFVRQILGHSREEARMKESAAFILSQPPKWDGAAPTFHWYYATLAMFQQQGDEWDRWNRQLSPILVEHQRKEGTAAGSWDPQDEWSRLGGRLYQTAVCTLSLEVYYRYKPKQGGDANGEDGERLNPDSPSGHD
jgi:hypothetical protein